MARVSTLVWRFTIVVLLLAFALFAAFGRFSRRAGASRNRGKVVIVLTGTFYTDNWIKTHLLPLAKSDAVSCVYMVASTPVPEIEGVVAVYPSERTIRILGSTLARLATFVRTCRVSKADIVGGFHLLLNGLVAHVVASLSGKKSLYICGGGVRELEGGGYLTQNKLFQKIVYPSKVIERLLIRAACDIDYIVTMGTTVRDFFTAHGATGRVVVIPGGFDAESFRPTEDHREKDFDLITVGRVSHVKRLDVFVDVVNRLLERGINVKSVIVGDGPSMESVREDILRRKIEEHIVLAGWQSDVAAWLRRSRIFVLTSESEGLSQAMVQGMLCGLPAVVTDVGDLSDLVVNGENGFLIPDLNSLSFVEKLGVLLEDESKFAPFAHAARDAALNYSVDNICRIWTVLFYED